MRMGDFFRKAVVVGTLLSSASMVSGCGLSPSRYSENGFYNGDRTQIQQMPMDCTIATRRTGQVIGGTVQYYPGTAREVCVASNNANQRQRGTDPARQINSDLNQINRALSNLNSIQRNIERFDR